MMTQKMTLHFDLHVHTCYSKDSTASVDEILDHAIAIGLDGIAICDHDTVEGGLFAQKRVQERGLGLIVIAGIEVSTQLGHVIVLGIHENTQPGQSVEDTIKAARRLGGVVVIPHPFKHVSKGIGDFSGLDIDAVECFNSRYFTKSANQKASEVASALGICCVAGSDGHIPSMVGKGITEIDVGIEDAETGGSKITQDEVLNAIRCGNARVGAGCRRTPLYVYAYQMGHGFLRRGKIFFIKLIRI